ncbi:MAG TPA: hypothetical protein DCS87_04950 [Rheinheimera sp.]|nr:hypothetical protein [Rheinheimera sp.]
MSLFVNLTPSHIVDVINNASHYVILAAPGISEEIATALIKAKDQLGLKRVQVVLDISPKVARLGYGSHEAVRALIENDVCVRLHEGLRIGTLMCDGVGWAFASCPVLVESNQMLNDSYNAISLTKEQMEQLKGELPSVEFEEQRQIQVDYATVGREPVELDYIEKVTNALKIAPPQAFDLARQTQVYAAFIQFVELKFEGFSIQSRRIQLPKTLPLFSAQDQQLKDQVSASLKVLGKFDNPESFKRITSKLEELRSAYLVPVGHAGRIMLKSKRNNFEKELADIELLLDECKEELKQDIQNSLNTVIESIVPDLCRAVKNNPPPKFRGFYDLDDEAINDYVREELGNAFPKAEELVTDMRIIKFYKDVTYETLKNKDFIEKVKRYVPQKVIKGALLEEQTAVQGQDTAQI